MKFSFQFYSFFLFIFLLLSNLSNSSNEKIRNISLPPITRNIVQRRFSEFSRDVLPTLQGTIGIKKNISNTTPENTEIRNQIINNPPPSQTKPFERRSTFSKRPFIQNRGSPTRTFQRGSIIEKRPPIQGRSSPIDRRPPIHRPPIQRPPIQRPPIQRPTFERKPPLRGSLYNRSIESSFNNPSQNIKQLENKGTSPRDIFEDKPNSNPILTPESSRNFNIYMSPEIESFKKSEEEEEFHSRSPPKEIPKTNPYKSPILTPESRRLVYEDSSTFDTEHFGSTLSIPNSGIPFENKFVQQTTNTFQRTQSSPIFNRSLPTSKIFSRDSTLTNTLNEYESSIITSERKVFVRNTAMKEISTSPNSGLSLSGPPTIPEKTYPKQGPPKLPEKTYPKQGPPKLPEKTYPKIPPITRNQKLPQLPPRLHSRFQPRIQPETSSESSSQTNSFTKARLNVAGILEQQIKLGPNPQTPTMFKLPEDPTITIEEFLKKESSVKEIFYLQNLARLMKESSEKIDKFIEKKFKKLETVLTNEDFNILFLPLSLVSAELLTGIEKIPEYSKNIKRFHIFIDKYFIKGELSKYVLTVKNSYSKIYDLSEQKEKQFDIKGPGLEYLDALINPLIYLREYTKIVGKLTRVSKEISRAVGRFVKFAYSTLITEILDDFDQIKNLIKIEKLIKNKTEFKIVKSGRKLLSTKKVYEIQNGGGFGVYKLNERQIMGMNDCIIISQVHRSGKLTIQHYVLLNNNVEIRVLNTEESIDIISKKNERILLNFDTIVNRGQFLESMKLSKATILFEFIERKKELFSIELVSKEVAKSIIIPESKSNLIEAANIVNEIFITEGEYVVDLNTAIYSYSIPMKEILDEELVDSIFMYMDEIHQIHTDLYRNLSKEINLWLRDNSYPIDLAKIFLNQIQSFAIYSLYCTHNDISMATVRRLKETSPKVQEFILKQRQLPECKNLGLLDFLIKPVQRVCKYPLLFKNFLSNIKIDDSFYKNVENAYIKLTAVANYVNESKRLEKQRKEMVEIASQFTKLPDSFSTEFVSKHRIIHYEDDLIINQELLHCWIFSDIILIAKRRRKGFLYKLHMYLERAIIRNSDTGLILSPYYKQIDIIFNFDVFTLKNKVKNIIQNLIQNLNQDGREQVNEEIV